MSTPEGAFSVFPLAAAVTAPAGALSVFHHYRSSDRSPQEHYLYFPTATAVSAPAGALSIYFLTAVAVLAPAGAFPSPGPSTPPPTHSPPNCFPTAAAVPAPAGALSVFPHCRSCVYSRRSLFCISPRRSSDCSSRSLSFSRPLPCPPPPPLPAVFSTTAVVPALAGTFSIFPTTAVVPAPAGSFSIFPPLPQQWLLPQEHLPFCPHYRSSVSSRRSSLSIFHCRSSDRSHRSATCISSLPP